MFDEILSSTATLATLSNWLAVSFAVNSAYPIMVGFGRLTGISVHHWTHGQQTRILGGMAEAPNFDAAKFSSDLEKLTTRYIGYVRLVNFFIITWSALAAATLFYLLLLASFQPGKLIGPSIPWFIFLSCAVPVGLMAILAVHVGARLDMRSRTAEYDGILKYGKQKAEQAIEAAKEDLVTATKKAKKSNNRITH